MKRKILSLVVLLLTVAILLCSCAKAEDFKGDIMLDDSDNFYYSYEEPGSYEENESASDTALLDKTSGSQTSDRKIIMRYNFSVETKDLDAAVASLEASVISCGGYYESANVSGNTENGGWAELILRVPSKSISEFNSKISDLGNITSQQKSGDDVTTAYYDTENQLASLKIQQERLMEILEKAESLEDILKLETELTRVRTEIERLTTVLVKYDNLIDYTTVTVNLRQVKTYTEPTPETFGSRIKEAFASSFEFAKDVFQGVVIAVIWLLPYAVFITVVVIIIVVAVRSGKKKKKAKKAYSVADVKTEEKAEK